MSLLKVIAICTTGLLSVSSRAQVSPSPSKEEKSRIAPPDTAAVMKQALEQFFSGEYGRFRKATDEKSKARAAKVLYTNLFVLWYAAENSPARIADFNL